MPLKAPRGRPLILRDTLEIHAVSALTIPVLAFIGPRVEKNDGEGVRIRIPLSYRTRNHLGSMYFGVMACGCDLAAGLGAMRVMRDRGVNLRPSFKDLHAEFMRRAMGDVLFDSHQAPAIEAAADRTLETGERESLVVAVTATVAGLEHEGPVARFTTTLSMKHDPNAPPKLFERLIFRGRRDQR